MVVFIYSFVLYSSSSWLPSPMFSTSLSWVPAPSPSPLTWVLRHWFRWQRTAEGVYEDQWKRFTVFFFFFDLLLLLHREDDEKAFGDDIDIFVEIEEDPRPLPHPLSVPPVNKTGQRQLFPVYANDETCCAPGALRALKISPSTLALLYAVKSIWTPTSTVPRTGE